MFWGQRLSKGVKARVGFTAGVREKNRFHISIKNVVSIETEKYVLCM